MSENTPSQKPSMSSGKQVAIAVGGVLAFIVVVGIVKPEALERATTSEASSTPPAAPVASPTATPPKVASAEVTDGMKTFYRNVIDAVSPCDEAVNKIAKVAGGMKSGATDMYDGYAVAKSADESCFQAFRDLNGIRVADALEAVAAEQAAKTLEACQSAAALKRSAAQTASSIFDGDARPSVVSEFQEQRDNAHTAGMVCVMKLVETGSVAKVDMSELN